MYAASFWPSASLTTCAFSEGVTGTYSFEERCFSSGLAAKWLALGALIGRFDKASCEFFAKTSDLSRMLNCAVENLLCADFNATFGLFSLEPALRCQHRIGKLLIRAVKPYSFGFVLCSSFFRECYFNCHVTFPLLCVPSSARSVCSLLSMYVSCTKNLAKSRSFFHQNHFYFHNAEDSRRRSEEGA